MLHRLAVSVCLAVLIAIPAWAATNPAHGSVGGLPGLPTTSPLPSILPSPSPPSLGGGGGSGGTGGGSGGSGGESTTGGTGTGSLTGGSSGGSSTGTTGTITGTTSNKLNRAARNQLGDGAQGCVASPSRAMMSELSAQEPAPTLEKSEPAGMGGPQNTDALSRLVQEVATRQHMSTGQAFKRIAGPFPLAGAAAWSNDWHAYRSCPYPHLHEGLDMFANRGTPAVAAANGVLDEKGESSMSGLYVEVTDGHGTQYFYDHFEAFASKLHQGMRVHRGQVLGFVGNTGDASGGPTHLHFEVQPHGTPTPPKPWVDTWLLQAMQRARVLAGQPPSASDQERAQGPGQPGEAGGRPGRASTLT